MEESLEVHAVYDFSVMNSSATANCAAKERKLVLMAAMEVCFFWAEKVNVK